MSYVRREFLSARWKGDERRSRSVKRSSLGMAKCTPNKYSRRLKHLSLGMPPRHPLLHQQLSVCPSLHYVFIVSCVMCFAWSVCSLLFLGLFCFAFCNNNSDPRLLYCVGERHAPPELELLIGFACLLSFSCELFLFLLLSCWSI